MPNVAQQQPPPPSQPSTEETLTQGGITKMIVPTIMQCNMGGYLVSMPEFDMALRGAFEEVFEKDLRNAAQ